MAAADAPRIHVDVAVCREIDLVLHENVIVRVLQRLRVVALALRHHTRNHVVSDLPSKA